MAIAQSVAQCTICTSMSGLAGRLGHADAVARPTQGDQQARHPNAAPHKSAGSRRSNIQVPIAGES